MIFKYGFSLILSVAIVFAGVAAEISNFDAAKAAIASGLWEVARMRAAEADEAEAISIIPDSLAAEARWKDLLDYLSSPSSAQLPPEVAAYFRALAEFNSGNIEVAKSALAQVKHSEGRLGLLIEILRARIEIVSGQKEAATAILQAIKPTAIDGELAVVIGSMYESLNELKRAALFYQRTLATAAETTTAYAYAAAALLNEEKLRQSMRVATEAAARDYASLALTSLLLKDKATFNEGASLIEKLIRTIPDTPGVSTVFLLYCDKLLESYQFTEAASAYARAMETWPKLAGDAIALEGRGWAELNCNRVQLAIEYFERFERVASNDYSRARALLEQGDAYAALCNSEKALQCFRKALSSCPEAAEKLRHRIELRELEQQARELYHEYRFAEASEAFKSLAAKSEEQRMMCEFFEVLCRYGSGQDAEAVRMAEKLGQNTSDAGIRGAAQLWLGKYFYNSSNWRKAIEYFTAYLEGKPSSAESVKVTIWLARAMLAKGDFSKVIETLSTVLDNSAITAGDRSRVLLLQAEALTVQSRFDEAVLVLDRALGGTLSADERIRAQLLRADALFALGSDNRIRYQEALEAYRMIRNGCELTTALKFTLSFKIARVLEKLHRIDEAIDRYFIEIVVAYVNGRAAGVVYDENTAAVFTRAAFRLADEYESRGQDFQAIKVLEYIPAAGVPAASEALKRIDRIKMKGRLL